MNTNSTHWLTLVISLPTRNATARMRIWRALKALGCAVLRDGVYLLPAGDEAERALRAQGEETIEAGGTAHLLRVEGDGAPQDAAFRGLLDRSADYAKLTEEISRVQGAGEAKSLRALRREFNAIAAVDFFPGEPQRRAASALEELERQLAPGEPLSAQGAIQRLDRAAFQGRQWATRKNLWVDRMASAWLIRRFIDPKAVFLWLDSPADCPAEALGFDFDGAAFTHVDSRVTFEVLLASFGLDGDSSLNRLGAMVHYLDAGGIPVPEAAGLEMVLSGARQRRDEDDARLEEASRIFDCLYSALEK